jgi:hypothetical protein
MAEIEALCTALQRVVEMAITDKQDLNELDEIKLLTDSEVKDLCTAP